MHVWRVLKLQTARIHFLTNEVCVWYECYIILQWLSQTPKDPELKGSPAHERKSMDV